MGMQRFEVWVWAPEELRVDRLVEGLRGALLKVGATAAVDEQRVACEDSAHRLVVERQAAVGVAGRSEDLEVALAASPRHDLARPELHVGVGTRGRGDAGAEAAHGLLEPAAAGDVVGVHVRVEGERECAAELADVLEVALDVLGDRVEDDRLLARRVGEDVRQGARALGRAELLQLARPSDI